MKEFVSSPEIVAFVIAGFGVIAAYALSRFATVGLTLLERVLHRFNPQNETTTVTDRSEVFVSRTVFYLVLSFFLLLALKFLGFTLVSDLLDLVILYIPKLLLGAAIILAGFVLGLIAKTAIENLTAGVSKVLPTLVQYLVIISAIVTGLGQMEVHVTFVATLLFIVFAALLGSLSLAFALGSQRQVANLLARRDIGHFQIGDQLQFEDVEGVVQSYTSSGLVLETADGQLYVPATRLTENLVLKKTAPEP